MKTGNILVQFLGKIACLVLNVREYTQWSCGYK
jgi:hypothetical protein